MLSFPARVDLGAMILKKYFTIPKIATLFEPHHQIVYFHIQDTRWEGVLTLFQDAVAVFYRLADWANWICVVFMHPLF